MTTPILWSMTGPSVWPASRKRAPDYSTPASMSPRPSRLLKANAQARAKAFPAAVFPAAVETMAGSEMAAEAVVAEAEVVVLVLVVVVEVVVGSAEAVVVEEAVAAVEVTAGTATLPAAQPRHSS